jgi:exodeoxyribonuclease VII small subunit
MPEDPELSFEVAVSQLESIVNALERGEPDLAEALSKYETGVRLLTQCYGLLERAERSVALFTGVDAQGNPMQQPFDATATIEIDKPARSGKGATVITTSSATSTSVLEEPLAAPAPVPKASKTRRPRPLQEPEPDRFDPPF